MRDMRDAHARVRSEKWKKRLEYTVHTNGVEDRKVEGAQ